jgi:iron complex transport system ATP-binding protein
MRDGRVVADGPTAEMMQPPVLRKVFDLDVEVHELAGQQIGVFWN